MQPFSLKFESKALHQKLATYLAQIRNEEGLTMRNLAQKLASPHSLISKIETQHRRIDVAEFIYYCRALNRDPAKVLQTFMTNNHDAIVINQN